MRAIADPPGSAGTVRAVYSRVRSDLFRRDARMTADAHWAHCGLRLLAVRARATAPSTQHSRGRWTVLGGGWTDRRRPWCRLPAAAGAGPSMSILLLLFRAGRYVCVSAGPVFVRHAGMAN